MGWTQFQLDDYRCPGDDGPPRGGHCCDWIEDGATSSFDWYGNSYAANVFLTGLSSGSGELKSNSPYLRPISRVPNAARTIYYEENIRRWAWAAREDWCDFIVGINVGPLGTLGGWHGDDWTYTRSFVDAHAEYQKILIEETRDSAGFYEHYRTEWMDFVPYSNYGCLKDPGTTYPEWSFYRCIIIRGDGWQKDTLPAPTVCTNLINPMRGRPSYEACVCEQGCPCP